MEQGGNPVTVLPGLIAMSALMTPPVTHVNAVPAMMPFDAAAPSGAIGTDDWTMTVAEPKMVPLVARTVFVYVPEVVPAVNIAAALIDPPPAMTDQVGVMVMTLPPASLPTAVYCCVALTARVRGVGETVMLASCPTVTITFAVPDTPF